MPQTNKKEEWVQFYKKQLKVFFGKKSGWYVSQSAGSIKLEVITNGTHRTPTRTVGCCALCEYIKGIKA